MLKEMNVEAAKHLVEMLNIKNIIVKDVEITKNLAAIVINGGKLVINTNIYNLNQATNVAIVDINIKNFIRAYLGNTYEIISSIKKLILQMVDLPIAIPINKVSYIGIKKKVFAVIKIKDNDEYYAINLVNKQAVYINKTTTRFFEIENEDLNTVLLHDLRARMFELGELVPVTIKLNPIVKPIPNQLKNFPQCI